MRMLLEVEKKEEVWKLYCKKWESNKLETYGNFTRRLEAFFYVFT